MLEIQLKVRGRKGRVKANVHVDLAQNRWKLEDPTSSLKGIFQNRQGALIRKPWDVWWFQDRAGRGQPVRLILRQTPTSDADRLRRIGAGRVYAPVTRDWKDCSLTWRVKPKLTLPSTANSAIRRRILEICKKEFPQKKFTFRDYGSGPTTATGCGILPGDVFAQLPVRKGWRAFETSVDGIKFRLTSTTPNWDQVAMQIDKDKRLNGSDCVWIPFRRGRRPKPGDLYVLKNATTEAFQHVGVIEKADGNKWVTIDGGQTDGSGTDGYRGGYSHRSFEPSGKITGETQGGLVRSRARLKGWVDVDRLVVALKDDFPISVGGTFKPGR